MATTKTAVTLNDLKGATLEVRVHISRQFYIRRWLGLRLIWLATRVMGCNLEVSEERGSE